MTADSLKQYTRYWERFRAFQATHPGPPPVEQAKEFLSMLTPASTRVAKFALEHFLGQKISQRRRPYWRNEPKLEATVLRVAELDRLKTAALTAVKISVMFRL